MFRFCRNVGIQLLRKSDPFFKHVSLKKRENGVERERERERAR